MQLTWQDGVWEVKPLGGSQAPDADRSQRHLDSAHSEFLPLQKAELCHNLSGY